MPAFTLQHLAQRSIAIDMYINGRHLRLRGTGELTQMSGVGSVLRIHIPDPDGEFDVVLYEGRFRGPIVEDKESGCDFRISLSTTDLVSAP
jgi:hypothetical protein